MKIKCFRCKGKGTGKYDNGLYTEDINCSVCKGLGFVYKRTIKGIVYVFSGEAWCDAGKERF